MSVKKGTIRVKEGNDMVDFYPETNVESVDGLQERLSEIEGQNYDEVVRKANTAYTIANDLKEILLFPMTPIEMTTPSTFTANGSAKTPQFMYVDTQRVTIGGNTSESLVGNYTTTFTPKSEQFVWSDTGQTGVRSFNWNIVRDTGSISLSTNAVSLTIASLTTSITVTATGDGTITATSSNANVVTASYDSTTHKVNLTCQGDGSATVTVTMAQSNIYTGDSKTISVTCTTVGDFSTAAKAVESVQNGTAWNNMEAGDKFPLKLNGSITKHGDSSTTLITFNNETVYAVLLGLDHNSSKEGSGKAHFIIGQNTNGKDIAFQGSSGFQHYSDSTQSNTDWKNKSFIRNDYLTQFKNCIETTVRNAIGTVTKYTASLGGSDADMVSATETLFLLSEVEIFGSQSCASNKEPNYCVQYDYYKNGNSKVRYNYASPSSAVGWWERSPCRSGSGGGYYGFCHVYAGGSAGWSFSNGSNALAPALTIARQN